LQFFLQKPISGLVKVYPGAQLVQKLVVFEQLEHKGPQGMQLLGSTHNSFEAQSFLQNPGVGANKLYPEKQLVQKSIVF
jgi:hypothetical protein